MCRWYFAVDGQTDCTACTISNDNATTDAVTYTCTSDTLTINVNSLNNCEIDTINNILLSTVVNKEVPIEIKININNVTGNAAVIEPLIKKLTPWNINNGYGADNCHIHDNNSQRTQLSKYSPDCHHDAASGQPTFGDYGDTIADHVQAIKIDTTTGARYINVHLVHVQSTCEQIVGTAGTYLSLRHSLQTFRYFLYNDARDYFQLTGTNVQIRAHISLHYGTRMIENTSLNWADILHFDDGREDVIFMYLDRVSHYP